jgi:hypothetical protein
MHCILRRLEATNDVSKNDEIADSEIDEAVKHVLAGVGQVIESKYSDAYLAPLFKNVKKCADIRAKYEGG